MTRAANFDPLEIWQGVKESSRSRSWHNTARFFGRVSSPDARGWISSGIGIQPSPDCWPFWIASGPASASRIRGLVNATARSRWLPLIVAHAMRGHPQRLPGLRLRAWRRALQVLSRRRVATDGKRDEFRKTVRNSRSLLDVRDCRRCYVYESGTVHRYARRDQFNRATRRAPPGYLLPLRRGSGRVPRAPGIDP